MPDPSPKRRRRKARARSRGRARRPHTFKFRVSDEERAVIRERARGCSSPADYARRTLVAGWSVPVQRLRRVTDAFRPIQEVIEVAVAAGEGGKAGAAVEALREILAAVSER